MSAATILAVLYDVFHPPGHGTPLPAAGRA
jgi:hypothetical protein